MNEHVIGRRVLKEYDVVIVGAGPAGSTLAYRLAQEGLQVALLEGKRMPRVKPCGGGIDGLFMKHLPEGISLDGVIEGAATRTIVRFQGKEMGEFPLPRPIYMTQRRFLDQRLATAAAEEGADLIEDCMVTDVVRENLPNGRPSREKSWTVVSSHGNFQAPIVVGADGAYSTVARKIGIPTDAKHRTTFVASEWDVKVSPADQERYKDVALIDTSVSPMGYGWIFGKADHLNVGFGAPHKLAKQLKAITAKFVAERSGLEIYEHKERAHWIPFAKVGAPVLKDGVILVGDAAGVCDPTTGAGISWSVRSSSLAAKRISEALRTGDMAALHFYQESIYSMQKELEAGMALRNLLVLSFALRRRLWVEPFLEILEVLSGLGSYTEWAEAHQFQYRLGLGVQKLLVEKLI